MGKGAGRVSDDDTPVVLAKLAKSLLALYGAAYAAAAVAVAAAEEGFDVRLWAEAPFVHDDARFGVDSRREACAFASQLAIWVLVGPAVLFFIVNCTRKCWDYAATFAFLHFVLSCAVTSRFPTNFVWWLVLLLGGLWTSSVGELATYRLTDMRDIALDH